MTEAEKRASVHALIDAALAGRTRDAEWIAERRSLYLDRERRYDTHPCALRHLPTNVYSP